MLSRDLSFKYSEHIKRFREEKLEVLVDGRRAHVNNQCKAEYTVMTENRGFSASQQLTKDPRLNNIIQILVLTSVQTTNRYNSHICAINKQVQL